MTVVTGNLLEGTGRIVLTCKALVVEQQKPRKTPQTVC